MYYYQYFEREKTERKEIKIKFEGNERQNWWDYLPPLEKDEDDSLAKKVIGPLEVICYDEESK